MRGSRSRRGPRVVYAHCALRIPSRRFGPRAWAVLAAALGMLGVAPIAVAADKPLHLVLTPSQKPTNLIAAGEEFGKVLGKLAGVPIRVTVASDYAAVIEAL